MRICRIGLAPGLSMRLYAGKALGCSFWRIGRASQGSALHTHLLRYQYSRYLTGACGLACPGPHHLRGQSTGRLCSAVAGYSSRRRPWDCCCNGFRVQSWHPWRRHIDTTCPRTTKERAIAVLVGMALWASLSSSDAQEWTEDMVDGSCKSLVSYQSGTGVALGTTHYQGKWGITEYSLFIGSKSVAAPDVTDEIAFGMTDAMPDTTGARGRVCRQTTGLSFSFRAETRMAAIEWKHWRNRRRLAPRNGSGCGPSSAVMSPSTFRTSMT